MPELPIVGEDILKNRLVFNGRAGDGTFITTPSTCHDPETEPAWAHAYSTYLLADSVAEAAKPGYSFPASAAPALESPLPPGKKPIDCEHVPYAPTTAVEPNTTETDSPAGATTTVEVPHIIPGDTGNRRRSRQLRYQGSEHQIPHRARHQPLGLQGPARLQRRTVRQGHRKPGRLPARVEDRHGHDPDAAAAGSDRRQRLHRPPAQP